MGRAPSRIEWIDPGLLNPGSENESVTSHGWNMYSASYTGQAVHSWLAREWRYSGERRSGAITG